MVAVRYGSVWDPGHALPPLGWSYGNFGVSNLTRATRSFPFYHHISPGLGHGAILGYRVLPGVLEVSLSTTSPVPGNFFSSPCRLVLLLSEVGVLRGVGSITFPSHSSTARVFVRRPILFDNIGPSRGRRVEILGPGQMGLLHTALGAPFCPD